MKKLWQKQLRLFLSRSFTGADSDLLSRFQAVSARESIVMMTAALVIGLICGFFAVGLNWSVHTLRHFITELELSWVSIFIPALGAGIAVYLVRSIIRDSASHGVSDVIKAMALGSEILRRRMIHSRFLGSLLTVGTGGSTGLEGPIVSIGGAVGSALGRWMEMNERHKKLLVGYGAAAAVAGIFNAPLTGLIFSLEIIKPVILWYSKIVFEFRMNETPFLSRPFLRWYQKLISYLSMIRPYNVVGLSCLLWC